MAMLDHHVDDEFYSLHDEASRINPESRPASRLGTIRGLTAGTVSCFLAHWYLLPGLTFQRQRIRLGASGVLSLRQERSALAALVNDPPNPASYLDFDFALKALMTLETLGVYLDASSPSLFPIVLLQRLKAQSATLLSLQPESVSALVGAAQIGVPGVISCQAISNTSFDKESCDVVTSLGWLPTVEDDVNALRGLWSALRPGGTLLLSLSCAAVAAEERPVAIVGNHSSPEEGSFRRLYDMKTLASRVFGLVGKPTRFAIYGEATPGSYKTHLVNNPTDWSGTLLLGKDWQCYSTVGDLPGEGVIAMKFVKHDRRVV